MPTTPGADFDNNVQRVEQRFSYKNLADVAATTLKSGAGVLHSITVNKGATGAVVTVYDNTSAATTKIATINAVSTLTSYLYDCAFTTGLTIDIATGAADITITYR
jgi:predicted nucleic acid-binding OB-fold protein